MGRSNAGSLSALELRHAARKSYEATKILAPQDGYPDCVIWPPPLSSDMALVGPN